MKIGSVCNPDSKADGANMGPVWGRQDPGGPHIGHMNFAIWEVFTHYACHSCAVYGNTDYLQQAYIDVITISPAGCQQRGDTCNRWPQTTLDIDG